MLLLDATIALINGASLTLTSIGRYLPGLARVKNKIKRVDRLLGNESLHRDIPLIFNNIIAMLTSQLSLCVIAVDWSGYSSQEHHVLRASLLCDGCSLPLLSWVVPSEKQQNSQIQKLPRCPCRGCKPCGQSHNSYRCGCSYPLISRQGLYLKLTLPADVDILAESDNPTHYADGFHCNARSPLQGLYCLFIDHQSREL